VKLSCGRTLVIAMTNQCLAELSGVTKRFGLVVALDSLDLEVRRNELLAVLGPNGAGKTTAILLLLGLCEPDGGSARLFVATAGSSRAATSRWGHDAGSGTGSGASGS
jgi:ABC-type multidrug transport system ATPase subunit